MVMRDHSRRLANGRPQLWTSCDHQYNVHHYKHRFVLFTHQCGNTLTSFQSPVSSKRGRTAANIVGQAC